MGGAAAHPVWEQQVRGRSPALTFRSRDPAVTSHLCFRILEPEALRRGNMSSLGFTSKEQRNLGLLVHLMTTNPKILYAPIGSQADRVIQKVSGRVS